MAKLHLSLKANYYICAIIRTKIMITPLSYIWKKLCGFQSTLTYVVWFDFDNNLWDRQTGIIIPVYR